MRAIVVGGSIGGLAAARALRDAGCQVSVLERRHEPLIGRGAGIILQPEALDAMKGGRVPPSELGRQADFLRQLDASGGVAFETASRWRCGSWTGLYLRLFATWHPGDYLVSSEVTSIVESDRGVRIERAGAGALEADVVVLASGVASELSSAIGVEAMVDRVGYLAVRGTVASADLDPESWARLSDAITFQGCEGGHIVTYPFAQPIAGERVGFVWYRQAHGAELREMLKDSSGIQRRAAVPSGLVAAPVAAELRQQADRTFSSAIAETVSRSSNISLQAIADRRTTHMLSPRGRIAVIGDAAFGARPHAGAGTAKAIEDGFTLGHAVGRMLESHSRDPLIEWESDRLRVGRALVDRAKELGEKLNRPDFDLADASLRFGLHGPIADPGPILD